jgi:RHS repeat-associated protein
MIGGAGRNLATRILMQGGCMFLDSRGDDLAERRGIAVAAACLLGVLLHAPESSAAVGRTSGSFNVTPSGTATYTIPIFTPPGPNGMQPSVALAYSSSAGVGYVGRGWSITGFSSIERCNKTIAQDGASAPVYLVSDDGYCLDGNRLKLQSGSYGWSGSVWATEIADFSRITATSSAFAGPGSWTVERKDGTTWTYGTTTGSSVLVGSVTNAWYVSQIADRAGNKVRFTYKTPDAHTTGVTHPTKIEWTQTSAGSGSYVYSVDFAYTSNGNAVPSSYSGYVYGTAVFDTDLLASISVKNSGTTVRKYVLGYDTSATTGAMRLTSITECSDAGASDCLSPTTIGYQDGQVGISATPATTSSISASAAIESGSQDYNKDGIFDLSYYRDGAWYVRFGSTSGYGGEIATGVTEFSLQTFDPFGTGQTAILARSGGGMYGGVWHAVYWNGSSFVSSSTGVTEWASLFAYLIARDADGDGRDDLIYNVAIEGYTGNPSLPNTASMGIVTVPSTSTGSTLSFGTPVTSAYVPSALYYVAEGPVLYDFAVFGGTLDSELDLNGDGREDLTVSSFFFYPLYDPYWDNWYYDWGYYHTALVAGDNFEFFETISDTSGDAYAMSTNSDGCIDFYSPGQLSSSNCSGIGATWATAGPIVGTVDWNGDKRQDLLVSISGTTYVQLSTGQGLSSPQATGIPNCPGVFADANGDTLDDYICRNSTTLEVYLRNGSTVQPDLATSFTDGYGVNQAVAYVFSTYTGYAAYGNASYPRVDITAPMVLARTVTASDGIGGTYTMTYSYFGATEDPTRYGFEGFEKVEVVDSRNSVKRVQRFKREFPYGGDPVETSVYQPGGTLMSSTLITMSSMTLDATAYKQRYFPYVSSSTIDEHEVGGPKNGDWITRTVTSTTLDAWGNTTASTRTVTDKDSLSLYNGYSWTTSSSSTYTPNTTYWCLGLPDASSVTSSTTTLEPTVTRSKVFTLDYANCRISTEAAGSSNLQVDTSYGYDGFGNVNSVAVTGRNPNGSNMATRTTAKSWGTTGQFPVSETNALSQTTSRTFHSTFGSLLTETDPNGILVTNNTYSSFGRLSRETRADGTYTDFVYADCYGWACESGFDKTIIDAKVRSPGGGLISDSYTHVDIFDRPWIVDTLDATGVAYNRKWVRFDQLGRVSYEGIPCATFTTCAGAATSPSTSNAVSNTYDLIGRVTAKSRAQSQSVSTPMSTSFVYAGRTTTTNDPNSKSSSKLVDVNGWMRQSTDHDGYLQSFGYDAAGNLTSVNHINPQNSTWETLFIAYYVHGAQSFRHVSGDADLGYWYYSYNSLGEVVGWSDPKGQTFSQTHDSLSRLTSRTEAEGTTYWTWGTTPGNRDVGRLASIAMTNYGEVLGYDSVGRVSTRSITADSNVYDIDYSYNNQGAVDTLTYPTSTSGTRLKLKYGYTYGILQSVTDWTSGSAGTVYWTANTRNSRGQTTQETLGNGVVTNRGFDTITGRLNTIQSGVSGGTGLQNLSYAYDKVGNVTQRQENTQGLTENFFYDNLYRVTSSQVNANTPITYSYDAMGNITSRSDVNSNAAWTYHATKRHAVATTGPGGTSYSYDLNGNMTSRGGSTIGWTSYNYMSVISTGTESSTFYYGPDRQYYRQDYTGPGVTETTYYIGGLLEKVCSSASCISGTVDWRHNLFANGEAVAIVSRKASGINAVNYTLEDKQSSGTTLTDGGGGLVVRASFNAFGLARDGSDWDGSAPSGDLAAMEAVTRRGYTGHSMLGRMGLIHMNGRVQDATIGRFLSPDPHVPNPGFTQSFNRYSYVNNNPLTFTDPSGFAEDEGLEELAEALVTARRVRNTGCLVILGGCDYYDPGSPFGQMRPNCSMFQWQSACDSEYQARIEAEQAAWSEKARQDRLKWLEQNFPKRTAQGPKKPPAPPQTHKKPFDQHLDRNRFNRPPSTRAEAERLRWNIQDDSRSIYHRHGIDGALNTKYLSADGHHEAVYDRFGNLVTSAANMGTYNYGTNPVSHLFLDVVPYWINGNSPNDPTKVDQRLFGPGPGPNVPYRATYPAYIWP